MEDAAAAPYAAPKQITYENTYITEPEGYGEQFVFKKHKVQAVLKQALQDRMEGQQYDPVKAAQYAKQLADDLREKIKALGYDRHKLVVQVTLGQKKGQAMRIVSRCLWDTHSDSSASELYENETLYCVCQARQCHTREVLEASASAAACVKRLPTISAPPKPV